MKSTFIIAEAGVNHNGDLNLAFNLVDAAVKAGADAVKFQTFKSELIVSKSVPRAEYQKENMPHVNESQQDMIKKLELKYDDFIAIKEYCDQKNILFLSTTADIPSTDFIDSLVPFFKLGSADLLNYPLLKHIAQKGKPIILSTGMANLGDIERALNVIKKWQPELNSDFPAISVLHCTTNYPCPFDEVNLNAMLTIKDAFKENVGYSDHTLGGEVAIGAVAMGAQIIEKHFTLDRNMPGPDHKASMEPGELKEMISRIRNMENALGNGIKEPNKSEIKISQVARKSIIASCPIKKGAVLSEQNLIVKRPSGGIDPMQWENILGTKAIKDFEKDDFIDI